MQRRFDFETERRERFALLLGALRQARADEKLQALAKLVHAMEERGGPLGWTLARIGAEFGRSRSTVRRWLRRAEEAGLLVVEERRAVRGGQRTHAITIDWSGVRRLALHPDRTGAPAPDLAAAPAAVAGTTPVAPSLAAPAANCCAAPAATRWPTTPGVGPAPPCGPGFHFEPAGFQNEPPGFQSGTPIRKILPVPSPSFSPPPPGGQSEVPEGGAGEVHPWVAAARLVDELGLVCGPRCLAAAQAAGATASEFVALIDHWRARPGAWGLGALATRLLRIRRGKDPESDWPPPAAEYLARQAAERRRVEGEAAARQRRERQADRAQREADRAGLLARRDELEACYGAAVDALTDDEAAACLAPVELAAWRRRGAVGWLRLELLEAVAARAVANRSDDLVEPRPSGSGAPRPPNRSAS